MLAAFTGTAFAVAAVAGLVLAGRGRVHDFELPVSTRALPAAGQAKRAPGDEPNDRAAHAAASRHLHLDGEDRREVAGAKRARDYSFRLALERTAATRTLSGQEDHDAARREPAPPPQRFASDPLPTGERVDLVGVRWQGRPRAVWLRARLGERGWTRWARVDAEESEGPDPQASEVVRNTQHSLPVWVGGADAVQVSSDRPLRAARLHLVVVRSRGIAALASAVVERAGAAVAAVGRLFSGGTAHADAQPQIVPREEWARDECKPRKPPEYGTVKGAVIHHTVSLNDYSRTEAPDVVLAICQYHVNSNKWNDIGYNFLVDRYGRIYEGRAGGIDKAVVGAHAQGYNSQTTGIAQLGTFTTTPQTDAALRATAALIRWKLPLHGAPTFGSVTLTSAGGSENRYPAGTPVTVERITGHRDLDKTSCPGDALDAQLARLRELVGRIAPDPTQVAAQPTLTLDRPRSPLAFGRTATVTGRLATANGTGIGQARVVVEYRRGSRWRALARAVTASDGSWRASWRATRSLTVRARASLANGEGVGPTTPIALRVRARLTVALPRSRVLYPGTVLRLRGSIAPTSVRPRLVLLEARGSRRVRRTVLALRTSRRGRFAVALRAPRRSGRYVLYVSASAAGLAWTRTPLTTLTVVRGGGGGTLAPAG